MPFTLFCLGTDIRYPSQDPSAGNYRTMFKVARLIKTRETNHERYLSLDAKDLHHLSDQVNVLDGPDTAGIVVHNKIATGVIAVLNAMLQGETTINLLGFSRGGVIALHITHELQRIKDELLKTDAVSVDGLCNIICNANTTWSSNHLNKYYKEKLKTIFSNNANHIQTLINLFKSQGHDSETSTPLILNIFLLDPVPGFCEATWSNPLGWHSERHYQVPTIVRACSIYIHSDENSAGFRAICPTRTPNTRMNIINLPGFHSSGDGQPPKSGEDNDDIGRQGVQFIVFFRMLQFLETNGVELIAASSSGRQASNEILNPSDADSESLEVEIEHNHLDKAYKKYRSAAGDNDKMNDLLLETYANIARNIELYRQLRTSVYTFPDSALDERHVMMNGRPVSLSQAVGFDSKKNQHVVNMEHFRLMKTKIRRSLKSGDSSNQPYQTQHIQLANEILRFLEKCNDEDQDNLLNHLLDSHIENLDQLIQTYIALVPTNLVCAYFLAHNNNEIELLGHALNQLLTFALSNASSPVGGEPSSPSKKQEIINALKSNAVDAIKLYVKQCLDETQRFINQGLVHELENTFPEEIIVLVRAMDRPPKDEFINQFEEYFKLLNELEDRLAKLNGHDFTDLNRLNETITLFSQLNDPINHIKKEIDSAAFLDRITLQILSGFATIIGTAAVALSLTVLFVGSGGLIAPVAVMAAGVLLGTMGLYGLRKGAQVDGDDVNLSSNIRAGNAHCAGFIS